MTYQIRGPHIIGAILTAALFSLPLDWQVVEAVRMDVRMERAARAAEEREARRERDRAIADSTCVLSLGCVHGPERRGNQGVAAGETALYEVTSYSHGCAMPRDGRERAPRPAANGEWPVPGLTLAADWRFTRPARCSSSAGAGGESQTAGTTSAGDGWTCSFQRAPRLGSTGVGS